MTHFAHVFKNQDGWQHVLECFKRGNGVLYDFEFLDNPEGKNVGAGVPSDAS
jgi:saccharopine dehydrogenase (NAD+, L-lysine-forming)